MNELALLSMDVEDWYHLEYFDRGRCGDWSMLDGMDRFAEFLDEEGIPGTFFTLGELVAALRPRLDELRRAGHEIASHGPDHVLPSRLSTAHFSGQMRSHKAEMEDRLGTAVRGYRAPCFALDRDKLEALADIGFAYDSSFMDFPAHPLYGQMDLSDWEIVRAGVRRSPGGMLEYEIPLATMMGRRLPAAGGGYFRMFPWTVNRTLIRRALAYTDVYVFYIHPFECSAAAPGSLPADTSRGTRVRFSLGRARVMARLRELVKLLRGQGFEFRTFGSATDAQ